MRIIRYPTRWKLDEALRGQTKPTSPNQIVRAALLLGICTNYDPFAGSVSMLTPAEVIGYRSIGTDRDPHYFGMAVTASPKLAALQVKAR